MTDKDVPIGKARRLSNEAALRLSYEEVTWVSLIVRQQLTKEYKRSRTTQTTAFLMRLDSKLNAWLDEMAKES